MNAVILTSVLSAGNSALYVGSRVLWVLGKEGKAPSFLKRVNNGGVPVSALVVTTFVGMLCFLTSFLETGPFIHGY